MIPCGIAIPQTFERSPIDLRLVREFVPKAETLGYESLWVQEQIITDALILEPVTLLLDRPFGQLALVRKINGLLIEAVGRGHHVHDEIWIRGVQYVMPLTKAANNTLCTGRPGITGVRCEPVVFRLFAMALRAGCIACVGAGRRRRVIRCWVVCDYLGNGDGHHPQPCQQ